MSASRCAGLISRRVRPTSTGTNFPIEDDRRQVSVAGEPPRRRGGERAAAGQGGGADSRRDACQRKEILPGLAGGSPWRPRLGTTVLAWLGGIGWGSPSSRPTQPPCLVPWGFPKWLLGVSMGLLECLDLVRV